MKNQENKNNDANSIIQRLLNRDKGTYDEYRKNKTAQNRRFNDFHKDIIKESREDKNK